MTAKITSKGLLAIPEEVREALGGDEVEFVIDKQGGVGLRPLTGRVEDLFGLLARSAPATPVTVREMDKSIMDEVDRLDRQTLDTE